MTRIGVRDLGLLAQCDITKLLCDAPLTSLVWQESVQTGDVVSFQIADNLKAAKQAENLGSIVSCLVGAALQPALQPFHNAITILKASLTSQKPTYITLKMAECLSW